MSLIRGHRPGTCSRAHTCPGTLGPCRPQLRTLPVFSSSWPPGRGPIPGCAWSSLHSALAILHSPWASCVHSTMSRMWASWGPQAASPAGPEATWQGWGLARAQVGLEALAASRPHRLTARVHAGNRWSSHNLSGYNRQDSHPPAGNAERGLSVLT